MNPEVDAKRISRADGCRRAIEAPRGHAKSTTFTFKDDLHAAVYGYKHYIIILSDSSEQAEGFLVDIKTELEENAALKEDFGELEGKVWKSSVILLANGVKIEAIGSGKKIRGRRHKQWRPDLIVCDDLENDENVNTPEQRKKLRDWFYKAVSKAGDTYTDIVYIGTLLHFDALLANVAKNPSYKSVRYQGVISFATNGELWDAWESIFTDLSNDNRQEDALEFFQANREAMLEGTAVLWEEKLSYYDLMVIRISEGEASFNSEIQNDPIDPENCTFQEEWFDFWDDEGKAQPDFSDPKFLFIGANDPSLGKNKKSDTSSIIALAKDTQTGYLYVVIADIAKRKPDQIIEDALDASRRLQREYKRPYYKFGVETVQFQYYFAEIMRQRAAAVGEYLPIDFGYVWAEQGQGEPRWLDKWQAVIELEDCHRLDYALDLAQNLRCYNFLPRDMELADYGKMLAKQDGIYPTDELLVSCFDAEGYANQKMRNLGLSAAEHGYVSWNGIEILYEYSQPPNNPTMSM